MLLQQVVSTIRGNAELAPLTLSTVLTVFAALWTQVEHRTKLLAPWHTMSKGPTSAPNSVLLDYLSPTNIQVLPRALRSGHYAVALSVFGSILIKLLIVVSTGLVASQTIVSQRQSPVSTKSFTVPDSFHGEQIDTRPNLNVEGINRTGVYPFGSTLEHAFQPFAAPSEANLGDFPISTTSAADLLIIITAQPTISALVDVFSPNFDCQESQRSDWSEGSGEASVPGCNITWQSDSQEVVGPTLFMQTPTCGTDDDTNQGEGAQRFLVCAVNATIEPDPNFAEESSEPPNKRDTNEDKTSVLDFRDYMGLQDAFLDSPLSRRADFGEEGAGPGNLLIAHNVTCLICVPNYTVSTGNVTLAEGKVIDFTLQENAPSRQIPGLSSWQMAMSIFHSLGISGVYLGAGDDEFEDTMHMVSPASNNFTELFDADTLRNASIKTWTSLGAQVALLNYLSPTNLSQVQVQFDVVESRMCVQSANFYTVEIILFILLGICLVLTLFTGRAGIVPRDPSTIFGLAAILAHSPKVASVLKGTSNMSKRDLDGSLANKNFNTTTPDQHLRFEIEVSSASIEERERFMPSSSQASSEKSADWVPMIMKPIGYTLLCAFPLIIMVILLGLLTKSKRDHGIVSLPFNYTRVQSGWTLLPAALFVGVGIVYRKLNSSIRGLQPFYEISDDHIDRKRGVFIKNYSGQLAVQSLWHALRRKRYALMASTLATLCAPFLPIVVSGLFRYVVFRSLDLIRSSYRPPQPTVLFLIDASASSAITESHPINASTIGWFNNSNPQPVDEVAYNDSDPNMIARIMYLNAKYPQWTFSELALAELDVDTNQVDGMINRNTSSGQSKLTIEVPAVRGVVNCTEYPYSSARKAPLVSNSSFLELNVTFPAECITEVTLADDDLNYVKGKLSLLLPYEPGIIGQWSPASFGGAPCPTSLGLFGEIDAKGTVKNLTVFTCMPYVETVQADATFDFPSLNLTASSPETNLSTTSPPTPPVIPIESTAKYLNNDSLAAMQFGRRGSSALNGNLQLMNLSTPSPLSYSDAFFQALFQGIDPVSDPRSLLGATNTENLFSAIDHLYRIIMAQSLNTVQSRRVPATSDAPQPSNGVITYLGHRRLVQSATATYILVALLATMLICAIITLLTFKPKGLVSMEMNSIAARATLLVGAKMLKLMPEGAEWCSDDELKRRRVFEGLGLRLGWWKGRDVRDGERGRYGIDVVRQ